MPGFNRDDVRAAMTSRYADFYSQYAPLKPNGGELRGACPLHGGAAANFGVDPETGLWFCHSQCQRGGNVFDFLIEKEGLTFPEAVERVAAFAGLPPNAPTLPRPALRPAPKPANTVLDGPFLDVTIAEQLHQNLLDNPEVQNWLLGHRGLTLKTLIDFQVGLLPVPAKGGEWRICFPVFDRQRRLTNIRRHLFAYKPELTDERRAKLNKTLPWEKGLRAELYPLVALEGTREVVLLEGEGDTLLACQMGFHAVTGTLGAGNWKAEWTEALRGLIVTILYDGDKAGENGTRKVTTANLGSAKEVRVAHYPPGIKDLTEWVMLHGATAEGVQTALDAAEVITVESMAQERPPAQAPAEVIAKAAPDWTPPQTSAQVEPREADGGLPAIETNARHLRDKTEDALAALVKNNEPPAIFVRGGQLARVPVDESNRAVITCLTVPMLRGTLARCANFISTSEKRGVLPITPPKDVVEDILALPEWEDVPPLVGITTAPVFAADGQMETKPGYHHSTRLFYHETCPVPIPDTDPTPANTARAKSLILDDLLGDFPFVDEASRAHAAALLILPFVRPMIGGPTPLHLIDAPSAGTGKGLLAKVCTLPFTPQGAPVKSPPTEEAEWSKVLTSIFCVGASHLQLDNVRHLNSPSFLAALTSALYEDRLLGTNRTGVFENRLVWLATCNNIAGNDELTRRSIWIRLDAGVERPEARGGFCHPDLATWAQANRGALIGAALTLIRAWVQAGKPDYPGPAKPLGSFEAWTRVMGGILTCAGIAGFLGNRDEQQSRVDTETGAWHGFVEAWHGRHGHAPVVTADLFLLALEWMPDKIGDGTERSQKSKFGKLLSSHVDKVFANQKIITAGKATSGPAKNSPQYRLEAAAEQKWGDMGGHGRCSPLPRVVVSEEQSTSDDIHIGGAGGYVSHVSHVPPQWESITADVTETVI